MKGTRHNGRSGKNGVYNPLHNDRRFNTEHSEHMKGTVAEIKTDARTSSDSKFEQVR